jgi:hypothetical protein
MANKFQVKRTTVTGRTPNTTNSGNTHYIDTGELALNLTDRKMFSSNGTVHFEVGSNLASLAVSGNTDIDGTLILSANGILFSDNTTLTTAPSGSSSDAYTSVAVGSSTIAANSTNTTLTIANNAGVTATVSNNTVAIGLTDIAKQSLTSNGSNTVFTLTHSATADDLFVHVNGIYFHPEEDYTVSNTTLTFTTAPANTSQIRIRFMRAPSGLFSLIGDLESGTGSYDLNTQDGDLVDLNA